jgi:phosphoenolpyruvate carboxykinase (GTP)
VNWFRRNAAGEFLWPGFGENLRVLSWMIERCAGRARAHDTPIGYLPDPNDLDVHGLDIAPEVLRELTTVRPDLWRKEIEDLDKYFDEFGDRLPSRLRRAVSEVAQRLRP